MRIANRKDFGLRGFVILKGWDESYGIVVFWLSKQETERRVKLLNSAIRYWDYEIEETLLKGWEVKKEGIIFYGSFGDLGN